MSATSPPPGPIYSLLPAVFRTRDAQQGGQLEAFFQVLEAQGAIVRQNVWQLYNDQFIETCAPWVIPYIGELIGFDPVYTVALVSADSRAEVANTIGYRRRKGTLLAMEQVTNDVSGRTTIAVEEFKRLITTLSLRDVRPHHADTADIRDGNDLKDQQGPFTKLNRSVDVRRIGPRNRVAPPAPLPDATPLEIALHGAGRFNVPDIAVWMWRWKSRQITEAPLFALGGGGFFFSTVGGPMPLFQQPPLPPAPFARLMTELDAPEPISRRDFALRMADFYPSSVELFENGKPVDVSRIVCANLTETPKGLCRVPQGKIAIDPELGRIQYAADVTVPHDVRATYSYGAAAAMGGGPYDRTAHLTPPAKPVLTAVVGTASYPTLQSAVAKWNSLPAGSAGMIVLPNYESYAVDLTGPHAIRVSSQCQLLIAAADVTQQGAPPEWNQSRVTLRGDIEVLGLPLPHLKDGLAAPAGQVQFSGIVLAGEMRVLGDSPCVQMADCTLTPGRLRNNLGEPSFPGEASLSGSAIGACVGMTRVITGPVALPASCSVRIVDSIVDAGSPFCPAIAGADLASAGAVLHIEDSTVIGRVWTEQMSLASNTIFQSRLGRRDPWKAAVWASRRQTGCVRFSFLPWESIVPQRYECLPPNAASEGALQPQFISLRFGEPGYCMLSGDVPLAIWKGADNGSQMGVFQQIQETEAVTNIQIRSAEYLPANLERGVFLIPSRPRVEGLPVTTVYGYGTRKVLRCTVEGEAVDEAPGIGVGLL
jgi:hypothetical protein